MSRLRPAARFAAWNALAIVALLALVEGLASMGLLASDVLFTTAFPERLHARFDAELGWVNIPGLTLPDLYGPGRHLRTNARGFRGRAEVDDEVPAGKRRIICSGDSFTLGYGVGDEATWCAVLTEIDDRLETVNMGQGGYGLDQALLWYRRDAAPLRHQVHVLAFIFLDFDRMRRATFTGLPKPRLALEAGAVTATNLPLTEPSAVSRWLSSRSGGLRRLRVAEVARRVRAGGAAVTVTAMPEPPDPELRALVSAVLAAAKRLNDERSSRLALVFLPTPSSGDLERPWQELLEGEARALDVPYFDLVQELHRVPKHQSRRYFIGDGELPYRGAAGHYNEAGNAWVAEVLHRRLMADPRTAEALGGPR